MSVITLVLLVASLGQGADVHRSCGVVGAPPPASVAEFTRLEGVWNQAYLQSDTAVLDALWSDRITVTLSGMSMTKSEALAAIWSRRTTLTRYATSDLKIKVDQGVPIVTGKLIRSQAVEGRAVDDVLLFRKVYQRGPFGCWQVVFYEALNARE